MNTCNGNVLHLFYISMFDDWHSLYAYRFFGPSVQDILLELHNNKHHHYDNEAPRVANTDRNRYQLYTLFAKKQNLFVKSKNVFTGPSWPWSHGSWINNYLCNRCLSPLMLWVQISLFSRCTTLYIYGPCCTEIWNNVFLKKSYFSKVCLPEEVIFPEGLFTRRSHISRRFVYPKKKYDFLEKYDFFGWIKFHISLQQGPYIVYYTEITHTATICSQ
jgi:hypothetical protein